MDGQELKYSRLVLRKKQSDICEGLCSVSYYSKIENNQVVPDPEMLRKIKERLNLKANISTDVNNEKLKEDLKVHLQKILLGQPLEKDNWKWIEKHIHLYTEKIIVILFWFIKLQLAVELKDNSKVKAASIALEKESGNHSLNDECSYYLKKGKGIYLHYNQKHSAAFRSIMKAEELSSKLTLQEYELLNLYEWIGTLSLEAGKFYNGEFYLRKAVTAYERNFHFRKSASCRLKLIHTLTFMHQSAEVSKEIVTAEKIIVELNDDYLLGELSFEKGLYSLAFEKEMPAIHHFQMSYRNRDDSERLDSIDGIIYAFHKSGSNGEIKSWIEHSLETLAKIKHNRELTPSEEKQEIFYLFYRKFYEQESYEEKNVKEVIDFLEGKEDYRRITLIAEGMGYLFERNKDLENALYYYKVALSSRKKINTLL